MIQFLIGLVVISQLFAGAKDCPGRRDDCEVNESAYQAQVVDAAHNQNNLV